MILIVHELLTELSQDIATDYKVHQVVSVRPHLYRHGSPAGSVALEIRDAEGNTVAASNTRSIDSIGSGTYWHGYAEFQISAQLMKDTSYRLVLTASGYTFDESGYLGWCNGFDLGKYEAGYSPSQWFSAPLDFEVWSRAQVKKGIA